ncbi:MAG: polysaccharide deacetylase family protein [Thermoguttaceae bacterium]
MDASSSAPSRRGVKRYSQLTRRHSVLRRARSLARSAAALLLSCRARIPTDRDWILFPYYHHVLDDERAGFDRHLGFMRRFGQFVSLDDAVDALANPAGIGGRYFCVTFDDGFKSCATNATPILVEHACPAAFFVPTDYIGRDLDSDWPVVGRFFAGARKYGVLMDFLSWDDCRSMAEAGMTIGSHTCGHVRLSGLDADALDRELRGSKAAIEQELKRPCVHFACPWGSPGRDFDPDLHAASLRRAGYRSLLTTRRGPNFAGSSPFSIRREETRASEGTWLLRYFWSRPAEESVP